MSEGKYIMTGVVGCSGCSVESAIPNALYCKECLRITRELIQHWPQIKQLLAQIKIIDTDDSITFRT